MKKKLVTVFLTAALLVTMAGCGNKELRETGKTGGGVVKIAYVGSGIDFPNEALGIAIENGYLKDELDAIGWSYTTTSFAGGNLVNEALISKEADIAALGDVPGTTSKSKGAETTLLAGEVYASDAALVVAADSDINSIEELKGKTVATLEGSFMNKVLVNMLEDNGMSMDDINFTNMQSVDSAAAVETGAVDAALLSETQYFIELAEGRVKVLLSGGDKESWRGSTVIVAGNSFLDEHRDVATAVLKAYIRAEAFAEENYEDSIKILTKSGISEDALRLRFPAKVEYNLTAGEALITAEESVNDFLTGAGLTENRVNIADWLDASVYTDAAAQLK